MKNKYSKFLKLLAENWDNYIEPKIKQAFVDSGNSSTIPVDILTKIEDEVLNHFGADFNNDEYRLYLKTNVGSYIMFLLNGKKITKYNKLAKNIKENVKPLKEKLKPISEKTKKIGKEMRERILRDDENE